MCPGGIQRRGRGTGCSTQGRTAVPDGCGTVEGVDCGEDHTGAGLAVGRVGGGVAAGTRGREHRLPQLLRLDHGARRGRKVGAPRFRSRNDNRQSIRFTRNARFTITEGRKLRLPKIGEVKVAWSRELPSDPSSVTIIKDAAGRYFASFVVDTTDEPLPELDTEIGIDLGLSTFAVCSDGTIIESPKFFRSAERRLRTAQQNLSRKQKGSKNRAKARRKVARAHAKVADTRRDWAHQHSTTIIRENQAVFVEDLCVTGLARTRLAKSVHDAGWGMFTRMLEEKAARYGRTFVKVDRWFPSTQMCSTCGRIDGKKPLSVREWSCPCGAVHDRDLNAAKNILAAGRAERLNACGGTVSLPA